MVEFSAGQIFEADNTGKVKLLSGGNSVSNIKSNEMSQTVVILTLLIFFLTRFWPKIISTADRIDN